MLQGQLSGTWNETFSPLFGVEDESNEDRSKRLSDCEKKLAENEQNIAKSPAETRALWNRTMFDGEYYRYVW